MLMIKSLIYNFLKIMLFVLVISQILKNRFLSLISSKISQQIDKAEFLIRDKYWGRLTDG